ncbi:MAG: phenylalanine--tRNA ligase subunit beta [Spirochaetota bacterium]
MPKIEVNEGLFFSLLGRRMERAELDLALQSAKAELDEWDTGPGGAGSGGAGPGAPARIIKIELNDTNRPDLWSTAGIARQLRLKAGGIRPDYPFFSRQGEVQSASRKVIVEESVGKVRPFLAGFCVSGKGIDEAFLKDMIQTQEKLAWNFGRKRRSISMGIYRSAKIQWPVLYRAVEPHSVRFVPLQETREMDLLQILAEHPKGREYASILENEPLHPLLLDSAGDVLSYPPIINSADLGAVQVGDTELFIELTGTDLPSVTLASSIVACDFADLGWTIEPVMVEYPWTTPFGRSPVFPWYFQKPLGIEASRASKLLGKSLNVQQVALALSLMGSAVDIHGQYVSAWPAEYRNDFLHQVDLIEDIMIGVGMEQFAPERPRDFTIGRLTPIELLSRKAKSLLVGLGYQEMIYNYLGSGKDYLEKMGIDGTKVIRVANPMTENYEYVRNSPMPGLLGTESISSKAAYPHRIFEVGKVAFRDEGQNYGVSTRQYLGALSVHAEADFNEVSSQVATLLFYLNRDFSVEEPGSGAEDPRFIPGRQAIMLYRGTAIGVYGEVHPRVLAAWGINLPAAAIELDLDQLLS